MQRDPKIVCFVILALKITKLKTETDQMASTASSQCYFRQARSCHTNDQDSLLQTLDTISTATVISDMNASIDMLTNRLQLLSNILLVSTFSIQHLPVLLCLPPPYWTKASNGSAMHVYWDMTRSCDGVTGEWMRVAELDMTNSCHQCPSGLVQRTVSNIRICVRNTISSGCSSVIYIFHIS